MRINVYAEELTPEVEWITKVVDNRTFYGIRLFLASADALHHTALDDDRSAITFWVPWYDGENHHDDLITVLEQLANCALRARRQEESEKVTK